MPFDWVWAFKYKNTLNLITHRLRRQKPSLRETSVGSSRPRVSINCEKNLLVN